MKTDSFCVEPTNPGEVLACAGLAWLAERENTDARSGFVLESGRWVFKVPFPARTIDALLEAEPVLADSGDAVLLGDFQMNWWQQGHGLNQPCKFWAGQQSARSVLRNLLTAAQEGTPREWLQFQSPTTGRLGVDPMGSWDSLSLGWSPNQHSKIKYLCRPFVELLAFLALQRFPVQGNRDDGFRYSIWRPATLPIAVLAFARSATHQLAGWNAATAVSGRYTFLKSAHPIGERI